MRLSLSSPSTYRSLWMPRIKRRHRSFLRILGVGDQPAKFDMDEARLYAERHSIGQNANAKAKHAEELPEFPDVLTEPLSISELIMRQATLPGTERTSASAMH